MKGIVTMHKYSTCLWFNGQAEEAARFYVSIFPNSKVIDTLRWGDVGPGPKGSVLTCEFELDGRHYVALNAGPQHQFTPAISLVINCETQAEVDRYWACFLPGGKELACGWITDKFGVSWQVTPTMLPKLLKDTDQAKANRVMAAMMTMIKLDIALLQQAADAR
jgi:predicted 3-demethylubiquinone-9 3-methyltransferase (glyoxalase superfamily)